ncbi:MAG: phosphoribosyltransferase family protein [Nitrososphaerales archaeon]|jgi:orotate phosphoribosyltransferase
MIYVRKETKDQGRQKTKDGTIKPGRNVVVIDDVIATGGSTTAAISAIRSEGGEVEDTIVLIDRPEGARKDEKILEKWRLASLAD